MSPYAVILLTVLGGMALFGIGAWVDTRPLQG